MIKDNQELFQHTQKLINELQDIANNHTRKAQELQAAMQTSSMPTEILGGIRITAKATTQEIKNEEVRKKAQQLIDYIDQAFSQ